MASADSWYLFIVFHALVKMTLPGCLYAILFSLKIVWVKKEKKNNIMCVTFQVNHFNFDVSFKSSSAKLNFATRPAWTSSNLASQTVWVPNIHRQIDFRKANCINVSVVYCHQIICSRKWLIPLSTDFGRIFVHCFTIKFRSIAPTSIC